MESVFCVDPITQRPFHYYTQTHQVSFQDLSIDTKLKIDEQIQILNQLKGFQQTNWEFKSPQAQKYRSRKLQLYLLKPQASAYPSFITSRELRLVFASKSQIQVQVDLSEYYPQQKIYDTAKLVTIGQQLTKQIKRKILTQHPVPQTHPQNKLILKFKGRNDYIQGPYQLLSFKQVRKALREQITLQLVLTEIPIKHTTNFPQKGGSELTQSIFFWYPPSSDPLDTPRAYHKIDPNNFSAHQSQILTGKDSSSTFYTGDCDWEFRVRICGLEAIHNLYTQGEAAVKNGKENPEYVTFFREKDRLKTGRKSSTKFSGIRKCSVPILTERSTRNTFSRLMFSRSYTGSLSNTAHLHHGKSCRELQDLVNTFKLPFYPYVLTFEVLILYGDKILRQCNIRVKYVPFKYFVRFYNWINFPIKISEIPKQSRIALNIYTISNKGSDLIIGSTCKTIFDEKGNIRTGLQAFNVWPFYRINQNFASMQEFWGSVATNTTLVSDKRNPLNYCRIYIQFDSFVKKNMTYSLKDYRNLKTTYQKISNLMLESEPNQRRNRNRITSINLDDTTNQQDQELLSLRPSIKDIASLQRVLQADPLTRLTEKEQQLIFISRYHIKVFPQALQLLLSSVDWSRPLQIKEIHKMLGLWHPLTPEQALALLNADCPDQEVRLYATKRIRNFSDDELVLYMPQLIQSLCFESQHFSPLGQFLIERALQSPYMVGHDFFWGLKSQLFKKLSCERFGLVLQQFLMLCGSYRHELYKEYQTTRLLHDIGLIVIDKPKNERIQVFKEFLQEQNNLPTGFSSPVDSSVRAENILVNSCRVMDSKKVPLFVCLETSNQEKVSVIYKIGDDLRQDILTLEIIKIMDNIWLSNGLDLKMRAYKVIATGDQTGFIQVVKNSETTSQIHKDYGGFLIGALVDSTLTRYIQFHNRQNHPKAIQNFIRSCAGYCVASYIIGIGDRHNGNIMIDKTGHIFHIDFGHFLGHFKKKLGVNRERSRFVFTEEMIQVMGGRGSPGFNVFKNYCTQAYNLVRKQGILLLNLFRLMIHAGIPELYSNQQIEYLKDQLALKLTDIEAKDKFESQIEVALNNTFRRYDNLVHNLTRNQLKMTQRIPPRARDPPLIGYYTLGEFPSGVKQGRFKSQQAYPATAATILQRNPHHTQEFEQKPKAPFIRTSGYQPGEYSNAHQGGFKPVQGPNSLTAVKLIQCREYASQSQQPSKIAAQTVSYNEFVQHKQTDFPKGKTLKENWLYRTKHQPFERDLNRSLYDASQDGPKWFQVRSSDLVKNSDIRKAPDFDGTMTVLSRISGWITVTPEQQNRQKRLGRYGPFDKNKQDQNFRNVSDLAPQWMQTRVVFPAKPQNILSNTGHPSMRTDKKVMHIYDQKQPKKSVFSIGDFRHNVMTAEEAEFYSRGVSNKPKKFIEWKEDVSRQRYDKPVTAKVGSIYQVIGRIDKVSDKSSSRTISARSSLSWTY